MDQKIWDTFGSKPALVAELAKGIRVAGVQLSPPNDDIEEELDGVVFSEGRLLTRLHRRRERSQSLRPKVLAAARKSIGIKCLTCGIAPESGIGAISEAIFEIHHIKPLQSLENGEVAETKVSDTAILCANCHRLIHKLISVEKRWVTPNEFSEWIRVRSQN